MYNVIAPAPSPHVIEGEVGELAHVGEHRFLGDRRCRPGPDVEHAHPLDQLDGGRQVLAIATGQDVHLVPGQPEVPGDPIDIDILAAAVRAPEQGQRGRMLADPQQPPSHGWTPIPGAIGVPRWGASPTTVVKASSHSRVKRSIENRSRAARRACVPMRCAAPGSARRSCIDSMRRPTSVATKPETLSSMAVAISVVARPTMGMPIIMASTAARPRLV